LTDAAVLPGDTPPVSPTDTESSFRKYRRLVPWAVGLSVATLVVLSVYYQGRHGADVLAELKGLAPWTVPAAVGLHLLMQACWGLRIKVLGDGLGAPVRYRRAVGLVTSGLFAAAVTPGRVGGEPWRIAMLVRGGASAAAASRTILADRATDMLFFLLLGGLAALALPFVFGDAGRVQALGFFAFAGLACMVAVCVLALVRPRPLARALAALARVFARLGRRARKDHAPAIEAFFREVSAGLRQLVRESPSRLAGAALLSVALWSCELSILWVVLEGFGFGAPYLAVYLAGVLVVMIASVPALPGGTGLAEVAALALLTPLAPGLTPAFLVVWRGLTYYVDLSLGGVVAGVVVKRRPSAPSRPTP
jgi:uncharacterized protein (TIRG00374 family)